MPLKIFHTADIHLGMKFAAYEEVREKLIEARFQTLANMVETANKEQCRIFVIAGDLFNRVKVDKKDIIRAAQIINEFQGNSVLILPGNHDYISPGQKDLWYTFIDSSGDNVKILSEKKVYSLTLDDVDAHIYACPCDAKHSSKNSIKWINDHQKDEAVLFHIGIAHGSLEGVSPDFDKKYFPMTKSALTACGLDAWLLGHTHLTYPEKAGSKDRLFFPGTPEPDGFDCRHQGSAFIIEINDDKKVNVTSLNTGTNSFLETKVKLAGRGDIEKLVTEYVDIDYGKTMLRLILEGVIPAGDKVKLNKVRDKIREMVLYLDWNAEGVMEEITLERIQKDFSEGSFPYILLNKLVERGDQETLQMAYELIAEVRK